MKQTISLFLKLLYSFNCLQADIHLFDRCLIAFSNIYQINCSMSACLFIDCLSGLPDWSIDKQLFLKQGDFPSPYLSPIQASLYIESLALF